MSGFSTVTGAKTEINALDWQESVIDYTNIPPAAPSNGDRYIVFPGGLGAWAGYDNYIVEYKGSPIGSWEYIQPDVGTAAYIDGWGAVYVYLGGPLWVPISTVLGFISGTATVVATTTSLAVAHGSVWVPGDDDIRVTPLDNLNGRSFWIDNIGAVTFRLNIDVADLVDHEFNFQLVI